MQWANKVPRFSIEFPRDKGGMTRGRKVWKNSDMVQPLFYGRGNGKPERDYVQGRTAGLQWQPDLGKNTAFLRWSLHNICFPPNSLCGEVSLLEAIQPVKGTAWI